MGIHNATKILEKIEESHTRILDRLYGIKISNLNEERGELGNKFGAGENIEAGKSRTMLHYHNRGLNILPEGRKLPDMTFVQFIIWLCGDCTKDVRPLQILKTTYPKQNIP